MILGSHNVVVGQWHNFSRFGGLVVGHSNTISGDYAVVSGGYRNEASGDDAAVSGGVLIILETERGWAAGSEGKEVLVGNFRSP